MAEEWQRVAGLDNVLRWGDCCNVYLLRDGARGLLIDLGSGRALARLPEGVESVEAVLFTHGHRDQCQGAEEALRRGIALRFPERARGFVEAEGGRSAPRRADLTPPTPLLRRYPGRFDPPRPFSGAVYDIRPGTRFAWGTFDVEVLAAPGHIDHQVAYLVDGAGRRLAFCGDAIHSRGKLHEPFHLETDHYTGAGARAAAETLRALREARPEVLCPAHGPVTDREVWPALVETAAALQRLGELKDTICPERPAVTRLVRPEVNRLLRVSEHLWLWNNSYFLVSDEGATLMVDCQGTLPPAFWKQYAAEIGRPIEVVLVTHVHSDHVEGIEPLRALGKENDPGLVAPGLAIWAHEGIAEGIEQPHRLRRPWMPQEGTRVDRRLGEGERFQWREFSFEAFDYPGQTDLHAGYVGVIDGHRAILSGDNFYPAQQWGGTGGLCGLNGGHPLRGWRRSVEKVLELEPDWILASHMQPFPYRRADFLAMRQWTEEVTEAMKALAPDGSLERHHDPHIVALEPYAQDAGSVAQIRARVQNPYTYPVEISGRLVVPEGWRTAPEQLVATISPGETAALDFVLTLPSPAPAATMVTLDLTFDGQYWGEKSECYLWGTEA
jgi:glyoxylase-like metal-dependent hydrolase (beta-lactamase superfamily II)